MAHPWARQGYKATIAVPPSAGEALNPSDVQAQCVSLDPGRLQRGEGSYVAATGCLTHNTWLSVM